MYSWFNRFKLTRKTRLTIEVFSRVPCCNARSNAASQLKIDDISIKMTFSSVIYIKDSISLMGDLSENICNFLSFLGLFAKYDKIVDFPEIIY